MRHRTPPDCRHRPRPPGRNQAPEILTITGGVLDHPSYKLTECKASEGRQFRHKRRLGHPRLGVDFQNHELPRSVRRIVISEVRPAHAATAERLMRHEG